MSEKIGTVARHNDHSHDAVLSQICQMLARQEEINSQIAADISDIKKTFRDLEAHINDLEVRTSVMDADTEEIGGRLYEIEKYAPWVIAAALAVTYVYF